MTTWSLPESSELVDLYKDKTALCASLPFSSIRLSPQVVPSNQFFLSFAMYPVTALLSSLALGLTAQAAPSLKVTVSLANGDDHGAAGALPHVDASVINTGDDDVYIRPYNTILQEGWSTHDFEIDGSEADGEAPAPKFKGVFVRRRLAVVSACSLTVSSRTGHRSPRPEGPESSGRPGPSQGRSIEDR